MWHDALLHCLGPERRPIVVRFMPSADQPTRRKQTGFNNERFIGWCAGSSFLLVFDSFQSSTVFQMTPANQPTRRNLIIPNMFNDQKTHTKNYRRRAKTSFGTRHTSRRDDVRLTSTSKNRPVSSRRLVCGEHKTRNTF